MKDSFIFYRSFYEALKHLPDKEFKELFLAISEYALNGTEPSLEGSLNALFLLIKPNLDANLKRYEKAVANASKRWKGNSEKKDNEKMLHECYTDATSMLHRCYDDATRMLHECYNDATQCYDDATPMLHDAKAMLNVDVDVNVDDDVDEDEKKINNNIKPFENSNGFVKENLNIVDNKEVKERKEKKSAKKENKESDKELHKAIIKTYHDWYSEKFGHKPIINGIDGKAVKTIIDALTPISGMITPEYILNSLGIMLSHYSDWNSFHQRQVRLYQIAANIPNILAELKKKLNKPSQNIDINEIKKSL